jgi:hypothetical protein
MEVTPVQTTSVTQITNPDGSTRTVHVDRSAVYTSPGGQKYTLALDPMGYKVTSSELKKPAILRATSTNTYIYVLKTVLLWAILIRTEILYWKVTTTNQTK